MFWFVVSLLAVGGGAAWLAHEGEKSSTRTPPHVGGDDPPDHGRLAQCKKGGWDKFTALAAKGIRLGTKALAEAFAGKSGGKVTEAYFNAVHLGVKKLGADERAAWFNHASNDDVTAWAIGWSLAGCRQSYQDTGKRGQAYQAILAALGITVESYQEAEASITAALKTMLWMSKGGIGSPLPPCFCEHALQAILIVRYGSLAESWPKVKAALDRKPRDWSHKQPGSLADWVTATLQELAELGPAALGDDAAEAAALRAESTEAQLGADPPAPEMPPPVVKLLQELLDRLKRNDAEPADVRYEDEAPYIKRLILLYHTGFRAKHADELLSVSYAARPYTVKVINRVIEAQTGAEVDPAEYPSAIKEAIARFTDFLERRDIPPVRVTYDGGREVKYASNIVFWFWTPFRAERAREELPGSYKIGGAMTYLLAKAIGQ